MPSAGTIYVDMFANTARFESDMGKAAAIAEKRMKEIDKLIGITKNAMGALGLGFAMGATLDKVKEKIEGAISSAAGLQQLSERTGAAVEQLSGLASVAKLSGTDTEQLAVGLQKLNKSAIDAENGGQKTAASFKAIGISVNDLKGKRPDEMFDLVAKRLDAYQDGAEKTVIAQNLLGKSGANLLPMMKDLAEVGDLQVKVTTEQAAAADELEKNQIRLTASSNAIYKIIAMELVPVFNSFTKALLDTTNANNGVKNSVGDLAKDGSIKEWAEGTAKAVGFVIDCFDVVERVVEIAGKSLFTYGKSAVAIANGDFRQALTGVQELWQNIDSILMRQQFSDRLKKQLEAPQASQYSAGLLRHQGGSEKSTINTAGLGNANNGQDPGQAFLEQLQRKIAKEQQDEFAMLRMEAAQKKVSDRAEKYIKILEADEKQKKRTKQLTEEINRDLDLEAAQREKLSSSAEEANAVTKGIQDQTEMLGLNAQQQQRVTALRQIDNITNQKMRNATADTVVELLRMAEVQKANVLSSLQANIDKQNELNASWQYGSMTALQSYLEDVQNVSAKVASSVTNAFKGMEDALVTFAQTGKLSFTAMANSIISDLLRIAVQQSVMGPMSSFMRGLFAPSVTAGSNSSGYSGTLNNPSAYVATLATGTNYVPYDGFPAILHQGEAVVPKSYNPAAGGSQSQPVNITINATVGDVASRSDVVQGMQVVRQQIMSQLSRSNSYGGGQV